MDPKDPLTLQRLIDGECHLAEIRALLANAADHPEHWQHIATAFVEDQIWQRQFQSQVCTPVIEPAPGEITDTDPQSKPIEKLRPLTDWSHSFNRIQWLAMAACLMLAAMTGYFVGQDRDGAFDSSTEKVAGNSVLPANPALNTGLTPTPKFTPASLKADYSLQLVDGQGTPQGSILDGEIPLYAVNSREQLNQFRQPQEDQFHVSPETLQQLAGQGFQVRQNVDFISGNLKDGRTFVVPVRTINFLSGQ